MTRWVLVAALALLLALLGCAGRHAPTGFRLPPGDAEAGKAAFGSLQCNTCHSVDGVQFPAPTHTPVIALGGDVARPPTDGELTREIINPSAHYAAGYPRERVAVDGHSRMPDLTTEMSVRQLADLVTFLQAHYRVLQAPPR